jgi:hypothetical protein
MENSLHRPPDKILAMYLKPIQSRPTRYLHNTRLWKGAAVLLCLGLFTLACQDRDDGPLIEMAWDQTKCADPWGTGEGDSNVETEAALLAYLEAREIFVERVRFAEDSTLDALCEACICGTGQRILVLADGSFVGALRDIGFYLE